MDHGDLRMYQSECTTSYSKKRGFGTKRQFNQQFVGSDTLHVGSTTLSQLPTFTITDFTASLRVNPSGSITLYGTASISGPTEERFYGRRIALYYTTDSNPSLQPATMPRKATIGTFQAPTFGYSVLLEEDFAPGNNNLYPSISSLMGRNGEHRP